MANRAPNNPNQPTNPENPTGSSFNVSKSFQELETTLNAGNLASEIIEKKKALFLEWLTSNIFSHATYPEFKSEQDAAWNTALEIKDYHARLATKDAEFKRIYDSVQSLNAAGLSLSDVNAVGLGSLVSSASQEVTVNNTKLVSLKKHLIDKSYRSTIWWYIQTMKQKLWADVIWAGEYAKMESFIMKFLDPSTGTVTLPWDKKITFKSKDLSFQKVNGNSIANLDQYSLSGDTWYGWNLFVPHFVIDAERTDPEIAKLLMSWNGTVANTWSTVNFTDKHLKFLPYVFMSAALGDAAEATKKIRASLGLAPIQLESSQDWVDREMEWIDTVPNHKEFAERFNNLSWDAWVRFIDGKLDPQESFLYFNDFGQGIHDLPGGGNNRVKASLVQEWDNIRVTLQDNTDFDMTVGKKSFTYPLNGSSMDFLIDNRGGSDNIIKAKPSASLKDLTESLWYLWGSNNLWWFDDEALQSARSGWHVYNGDETRSHDESMRNISDITYLWSPSWGNEYTFYNVDQWSDSVTVSYSNRSKTMDYTTFALFVLDKGLLPFSDHEYENATKKIEEIEPGSVYKNGFWKRISIWSIGAMLKWIPDAFMATLKKDEELRTAEAEVWLYEKLWFIPWVDKYDAQKKLDGLVLWEMEQRKNQLLGMDVEGNSATSEKKEWIAEVDKDFQNLNFGNKSHMRTLWGDFLYVLELNELYEWPLSKYSSEHMWVKKLLWPKHYAAFRKEYHKEYAAIRNLPEGSADRRDALVKMELNYIAKHTKEDKELQRVYGTKFYKTIEDYTEEKIGTTAKGVKEHSVNWPFSQVFGAAKASLGKLSSAKFIGFLEVALSKVDTKAQRDLVNKLILQYYVTWTNSKAIKNNADRLEDMGRRYGNPLLKLANNINASRIIVNLADQLTNRGKALSKTLSYWGPTPQNGEFIEMHNYSLGGEDGKGSHKDRLKQSESWRKKNGKTFTNAIYFNSTDIFKKIASLKSTSSTDEEKTQLQDIKYFYEFAVLGNDGPTLWDNESAHQSSPLYSDSIMNLTGGAFKDLMFKGFNKSNWTFSDRNTKLLWSNLLSKITNLDAQISSWSKNEEEHLLHFVTKKYIDFFQGEMTTWDFNWFKRALKKGNWEGAKIAIENTAFRKWYYQDESMEKTFLAFAEFFKKHAKTINENYASGGMMTSVFNDWWSNWSKNTKWETEIKDRVRKWVKSDEDDEYGDETYY